MSHDEIAARLQRMEDEAAIAKLVYAYAESCDNGYDPDGLAALFTEDACWSAASPDGKVDFGRHEGRAAIRSFFAAVSDEIGPLTLHCVLAPRLEISDDGRSGRGRWSALTVMQRKRRDPPGVQVATLAATYDHEYEKVDGTWLFARLHSTILFDLPMA